VRLSALSFLTVCFWGTRTLADQESALLAMQTDSPGRVGSYVHPINLKAEITRSQEIYVQIQINGSTPMWFLVDSAAGFPWIIDAKKASLLGPRPRIVTAAGAREAAIAKGVTVNVGDLALENQTIAVMPLDALQRTRVWSSMESSATKSLTCSSSKLHMRRG
jgi:hypothetical protein